MATHFELSDQEFEQQFRECTLNPELFTHEAHLRLAWIHVTKYGESTALNNISHQLMNYVAFVGASNKYNHTLTIAGIKAVYHFINKSSSGNFKEFIEEFPKLKTNFRDLMQVHYQEDIFNSEKAKQDYIAPDLMPFD